MRPYEYALIILSKTRTEIMMPCCIHDSGYTIGRRCWEVASVVMVSSSCIDVAVLKLADSWNHRERPIAVARLSFSPLVAGQPILALGHAVWGSLHRKCNLIMRVSLMKLNLVGM